MVDNEAVERVWNSPFGRALFNLYTQDPVRLTSDRPKMFFSRRVGVVKAMIATMLEQEQVQSGRERVSP